MCGTELDLIIRKVVQNQLNNQSEAHAQGHLKIRQNDGKSFFSFLQSLIKNREFFLGGGGKQTPGWKAR